MSKWCYSGAIVVLESYYKGVAVVLSWCRSSVREVLQCGGLGLAPMLLQNHVRLYARVCMYHFNTTVIPLSHFFKNSVSTL
jgi:hypothetical protein